MHAGTELIGGAALAVLASIMGLAAPPAQAQDKPNIIMIMADFTIGMTGRLRRNPQTVATGPGNTVREQTESTLAKLEASLLEAGTDKHRILEAVVYLRDMATKQEMDDVWCNWIPDDGWRCRACVGADLVPGDLVEIKLTATKWVKNGRSARLIAPKD